MSELETLEEQLRALRADFDQSFAFDAKVDNPDVMELLEIGVGKEVFALALNDVRGLYADPTITALPTRVPSLLGLAGVRGATVAVHDLAALLGVGSDRKPRWLVVAREAPVAFSFTSLGRTLRLDAATVIAAPEARDTLVANVRFDAHSYGALVQMDRVLRRVQASSHGKKEGQ